MLSSTEGKSIGDLENRVKVLEERLENLISIIKRNDKHSPKYLYELKPLI